MGHYITIPYKHWFILYTSIEEADFIIGEGEENTRIDSPKEILELFNNEEEFIERINQLNIEI
jgi:tRNA uridine 5-carbamoylmethylation protein Kti12